MTTTESEYENAVENYGGYCTTCRKFTNTEGVEPDAENYECDVCENKTVMGAEQALMSGHIAFG